MKNLFKTSMTVEAFAEKILANPLIASELELRLLDYWNEFALYLSDERWDERAKSSQANILILYLPKLGDMLDTEKLKSVICQKLRKKIREMTGLAVKSVSPMKGSCENFEVEFLNDIPRPKLLGSKVRIIS